MMPMRALVLPVFLAVAIDATTASAMSCGKPQIPDALASHVELVTDPDYGFFMAGDGNEVPRHDEAPPGGVWLVGSQFGLETFPERGCAGNPSDLEVITQAPNVIALRVPDDAVDGDGRRFCESTPDEWSFSMPDQCSCVQLNVVGTAVTAGTAPSFTLTTRVRVEEGVRGCWAKGRWDFGVADYDGSREGDDVVIQAWMAPADVGVDTGTAAQVTALATEGLAGFFLADVGERNIAARLIRLSDGATSELVTTSLLTTHCACTNARTP